MSCARGELHRKCCAQAEAYGVLLYCNTFTGGEVRIVTEHDAFAQRLPLLFKKAFRITFDRLPQGDGKHIFSIQDPKKLQTIRQTYGAEGEAVALHINFAVLEEPCCRMYLLPWGFFWREGRSPTPKKGYHLELTHLPSECEPGDAGPHAGVRLYPQGRRPKGEQRHLL